MSIINHLKFIFIFCAKHHCMGIFDTRQMPQPDISALKDDLGTLPLSNDYMPAVMQALHYYTEMMQYEQVKNTVTTTKRPPSTTFSTTRKTTTTPRKTTLPPTTTRKTTLSTTSRPPTTTTRKTKLTTKRKPLTFTTRKPITFTTPRKPLTFTTTRKPLISRTTRRFSTTFPTITKRTTTKYPYYTSIKNPNTIKPPMPFNRKISPLLTTH